jgi:high-affinity nickel-transport protein
MSLMDTLDGAFMAKAYTWAFASPIRKVFYNMTITSLSVFVALFVGVVELVQIVIRVSGLHGRLVDAIANINFLGAAGYVVVAAFVVTWGAAFVIYKVRRLDERWSSAMDKVA